MTKRGKPWAILTKLAFDRVNAGCKGQRNGNAFRNPGKKGERKTEQEKIRRSMGTMMDGDLLHATTCNGSSLQSFSDFYLLLRRYC
jgi:hypothetical protein